MGTDESDDHCGYRQDIPRRAMSRWNSEVFVDDALWSENGATVTCLRDPWTDHDRCIWHAETEDKWGAALIAERADGPERLHGAYLVDMGISDPISFYGCWLRGANLRSADLPSADLTDANLRVADLTDANLWRADLTDADLLVADLTDADLRRADLTDANPRGADLTDADLRRADLTDADLQDTTFAGVVLGGTTFCNVQLNHQTRFTHQTFWRRINPVYGPRFEQIGSTARHWNRHARDAHALARISSKEGLIRQARILTMWTRRARRKQARSTGSVLATLTAISSWMSWQATGYGISVRRVGRNMLILFGLSTMIYLLYGIQPPSQSVTIPDPLPGSSPIETILNTLYFSTVTFTTTPPWPVSGWVNQMVAMIETFLGTLLIVLLGYVLGNREQI